MFYFDLGADHSFIQNAESRIETNEGRKWLENFKVFQELSAPAKSERTPKKHEKL